jgi:hypothetical protein
MCFEAYLNISGFCPNLNSQFINDKCSDNGYPGDPFVQINGKLLYCELSPGDAPFIVAPPSSTMFVTIF